MYKKIIVFCTLLVTFNLFSQTPRGVSLIKEIKKHNERRWAICIGINDYEDNSIVNLHKARNDAKELAITIKNHGQFDYVFVMTDNLNHENNDYPSLKNFKKKLNLLKGFIEPNDLVLILFSGHGISNPKGESFLVLADSYRKDFFKTSLRIKYIIDWFKEIKVRNSLLLIDACREKFQDSKSVNLKALNARRFKHAEVGAVFFATKSGCFSYEDDRGNFGIFTHYIINALCGDADNDEKTGNRDGIVTFTEMVSFVEEKVLKWSIENEKSQKPVHYLYKEKFGDIPITISSRASTMTKTTQTGINFPSKSREIGKKEKRESFNRFNSFSRTDFITGFSPPIKGDVTVEVKVSFIEKRGDRTLTRTVEFSSSTSPFFEQDWFNIFDNLGKSLFEDQYELKEKIVIDHARNLMWQHPGSQIQMTFVEAQKWIINLNKGRHAGFEDWRLPTLRESSSLLKKLKNRNSLYIAPVFSNKQTSIWTCEVLDSYSCWVIDFIEGNIRLVKNKSNNFVRAVRSFDLGNRNYNKSPKKEAVNE